MVVVFEENISNSLHIKKIRMYKAKNGITKEEKFTYFQSYVHTFFKLTLRCCYKTNPTTSSSYLTLTKIKKKLKIT